MDPTAFAERVLALVGQVPAGSVTTYGDVAELLGEGGPRGVGSVLARWGGEVAWWRVIRADGLPPVHAEQAARERLIGEGVPFDGERVDLVRARWSGPEGDAHGTDGARG